MGNLKKHFLVKQFQFLHYASPNPVTPKPIKQMRKVQKKTHNLHHPKKTRNLKQLCFFNSYVVGGWLVTMSSGFLVSMTYRI